MWESVALPRAVSLSNKTWWEKLLSTGSWKLMSSLESKKRKGRKKREHDVCFCWPGTRTTLGGMTVSWLLLCVTVVTVDGPGQSSGNTWLPVITSRPSSGALLTSRPSSSLSSSPPSSLWLSHTRPISCSSLVTALSLCPENRASPWFSDFLDTFVIMFLSAQKLWVLSLVSCEYNFNARCDQSFGGLAIER